MITLPLLSLMPSDPNENMAVSLALAGLAFILTIIIGRPFVTWLRVNGFGKQVRVDGPQTQLVKTGTPTMGGIMVTVVVVVITAVFNLIGRYSMALPIGILLAAGTLGAIDDRMTLVGDARLGLAARHKMLWLTLFAFVAASLLYFSPPGLGLHHVYVPFFGRFDIGFLYLPIATLVIVGTAERRQLC